MNSKPDTYLGAEGREEPDDSPMTSGPDTPAAWSTLAAKIPGIFVRQYQSSALLAVVVVCVALVAVSVRELT